MPGSRGSLRRSVGLPAVAIAERPEVEDRPVETEQNFPHRHQVEAPGLAGVERLPDVGEGDVRNRQVQVRDGGYGDE